MSVYVIDAGLMLALFWVGLLLLFPMKLFNHFHFFSFSLMLLLSLQLVLPLPDFLVHVELKLGL